MKSLTDKAIANLKAMSPEAREELMRSAIDSVGEMDPEFCGLDVWVMGGISEIPLTVSSPNQQSKSIGGGHEKS